MNGASTETDMTWVVYIHYDNGDVFPYGNYGTQEEAEAVCDRVEAEGGHATIETRD